MLCSSGLKVPPSPEVRLPPKLDKDLGWGGSKFPADINFKDLGIRNQNSQESSRIAKIVRFSTFFTALTGFF